MGDAFEIISKLIKWSKSSEPTFIGLFLEEASDREYQDPE